MRRETYCSSITSDRFAADYIHRHAVCCFEYFPSGDESEGNIYAIVCPLSLMDREPQEQPDTPILPLVEITRCFAFGGPAPPVLDVGAWRELAGVGIPPCGLPSVVRSAYASHQTGHGRSMGYINWIASYPKSGNTWMRAFLAAVVTDGESVELTALRRIAPDENMGRFYQLFMTKPIEQASLAEIALARPMAQRAMAASAKGFLFLKTHSMLVRHLGTPTIATDATAGAIYIVRNPLDVAVSYSEFRNRSVDLTIELMRQHGRVLDRPRLGAYEVSGSWVEHVRSWTGKPHDRLLVVRYEDMLADPHKSFGEVVSFLRMDVSPSMLEKAIELASFDALRTAEERTGFKERPQETKRFFRAGRTDQWKDVLTEAQIALIAADCEREMRRFGYWLPRFDELVRSTKDETAAPST